MAEREDLEIAAAWNRSNAAFVLSTGEGGRITSAMPVDARTLHWTGDRWQQIINGFVACEWDAGQVLIPGTVPPVFIPVSYSSLFMEVSR